MFQVNGNKMDFARKQLEKYGWEEGKGLGKNENGISEALKPKLKFDNAGVGHDRSEQFTFNWWERTYNKAAENVKLTKSDSGEVSFELKSKESIVISTKKDSVVFLKEEGNLQYGSFLKTSKLTAEGTVDCEDKIRIKETTETVNVPKLTDEQLFEACGGRTAHKGARHGLKLNGKLSRIEEQEKQLLKLMSRVKVDSADSAKTKQELMYGDQKDASTPKKNKRKKCKHDVDEGMKLNKKFSRIKELNKPELMSHVKFEPADSAPAKQELINGDQAHAKPPKKKKKGKKHDNDIDEGIEVDSPETIRKRKREAEKQVRKEEKRKKKIEKRNIDTVTVKLTKVQVSDESEKVINPVSRAKDKKKMLNHKVNKIARKLENTSIANDSDEETPKKRKKVDKEKKICKNAIE